MRVLRYRVVMTMIAIPMLVTPPTSRPKTGLKRFLPTPGIPTMVSNVLRVLPCLPYPADLRFLRKFGGTPLKILIGLDRVQVLTTLFTEL